MRAIGGDVLAFGAQDTLQRQQRYANTNDANRARLYLQPSLVRLRAHATRLLLPHISSAGRKDAYFLLLTTIAFAKLSTRRRGEQGNNDTNQHLISFISALFLAASAFMASIAS